MPVVPCLAGGQKTPRVVAVQLKNCCVLLEHVKRSSQRVQGFLCFDGRPSSDPVSAAVTSAKCLCARSRHPVGSRAGFVAHVCRACARLVSWYSFAPVVLMAAIMATVRTFGTRCSTTGIQNGIYFRRRSLPMQGWMATPKSWYEEASMLVNCVM